MKKLLNITLAVALMFQSFLGTGLIQASTTDEIIQVEEVVEVENLNEPVLEDVVEQEPIVKDEVVSESEVVEEMELPPQEDHQEVEVESTDVAEEMTTDSMETEVIENEVVEEAISEKNQPVEDGLDDVEQEVEYGGEDYSVITTDGVMTLATAYVKEEYRIPNTAYNLTSIKLNWWTLRGIPKISATTGGVTYSAFCIEPGLMHETNGDMSSGGYNALTFEQQREINRILMYGMGNNGDYSDDSYVATQVAIWEVVTNHPSWGTIWGQLIQGHPNRDRIYNEILENVEQHGIVPSFMSNNRFNPKEATLRWNGLTYTTTLTDENGVLSKYNVISDNGDVQVSQNGNQLTLTTTNPNADVTLRLTKQATTGGNTLYWVSDTKQDLVTGGQSDPVHAYLKIKVESVGNVNLIKKSVTGEVVPNTQFRVVGNGVDTTVTTGVNGEILVPNLVAGTYQISEVSVPSPYILDTTPKTVEIKPNETAMLEFTNDVAKGRLEIVKTSELGTLIQGAVFEIRQNGQVLDKVTTGFDGKATSTLLPLGEVEVVETYVPSPYLLDSTPKYVTLSYADMNTPVVFARVDVVNQTAKAQLKITKHGVNGEPIQGAVFDVKNANGDLVATLTTDVNGEATTQPLDLGTYIATETYVPAPYLLDSTPQTIELNYADMTTSVVFGTLGFVNEKAQGYFKLQKVDAETGENKPQGSASLKGAEYEVRNVNGDLVDTLITDENGYAETKLLPLGDYLINETKASEGYLVDPQVYSVSLTYEDMNTPIVATSVTSNEQVMKQPIEIMKVEGEATEPTLLDKVVNFFTRASGVMKPLQGAEFTITSKTTGQVVDVMVTDETGYAKSIDLPYDTYIVSETKVPHNHYQSSDFEVVINQNSNKPLHYTIANEPVTAYLKVVKVDAETGKVIPKKGVQFRIKNLDTGEYVKQKVTYPYPHTIDVFETNNQGMFITPKVLIYGNYQLEEVKSPSGYLISKEPIPFTIDQDDKFIEDKDFGLIKEVVVSNQAVKGQIKVTKHGVNGEPIENVVFEVKNKDGKVVETLKTNAKGQAITSKLPLGPYIVTEVFVPSPYLLDPTPQTITLEYADMTTPIVFGTAEFVNEMAKAQIKVTKHGVDGEPIENVVFEVKNEKGQVVETLTTDVNGESTTSKLPLGPYIVTEVFVPSPYLLDPTPQTITLEYADMTTPIIFGTVEFVNEVAKGELTLMKLADVITNFVEVENGIEFVTEELPLADVTFNVYAREDILKPDGSIVFKKDDFVGTFTTDENGKATLEDLLLGSYYATEIKAPNGVYIENVEYDFELTYKDMNTPVVISSLDVMNQRQVVKIDLTKVGEQRDESYDFLSGVTFGLFVKEDIQLSEDIILKADTLIQTQVTDENGKLSFETVLPIGAFYIEELAVDENYVLSDERFEFTYDGSIQNQEVLEIEVNNGEVITNELVRGSVELTKKSETGELLQDVEFELYSQFKEHLGTFTTDENGKIRVDDLIYGKYLFVETKTADRHQLLDEPILFSITEDGVVIELEAINELTEIHVDKYDEDGNKLVGAIMQIIDKETGEVLHEWSTTDETKIIEGLPHDRELILREIVTPNGYQQILDIEFTITDENKIHVFEIVDELTKTTIRKVDEKGNLLSGAHLQIIDEETGEIVKDWVTTTGEDIFEGLAHRAYRLHEVEAPPGYELAEDIQFTVTDENGELIVTMVDKAIKIVPTTGLDQNLLMIGGVALVVAGTTVANKKRKK